MHVSHQSSLGNVPLVSIITVVLNGEAHIKRTIESIINQTYKNIEYVIIDGGSTDNTVEIIKFYASYIATLRIEQDEGIYDAMNKGISLSTGEWIGILNADDFYEDDCVLNIVETANLIPSAEIIHGLLRTVDKNGKVLKITGHTAENLNKDMIEHPTCFIKKNVYLKHGMFDLKYKSSSDYDFMLRLKRNKLSFVFIEKILANFQIGGMSSRKKASLETLEIKYDHKLISFFKKLILFIFIKFKRNFN